MSTLLRYSDNMRNVPQEFYPRIGQKRNTRKEGYPPPVLPGEGALYEIVLQKENAPFAQAATQNIVAKSAVDTILEVPYADIDVFFKSMPYYAAYASKNWSGGSDYNLEYRISGGGKELFFDSVPIPMSDDNCQNPSINELIGHKRVGPWHVNIADGPIGFYMDDVNPPTVTTKCVDGPFQTGFYVRIKNTSTDLITIHENAFPGIQSVRLIKDYKPLMIAEALIEEEGNTTNKTYVNTPITTTIDEEGNTTVTAN